MKRHFKAILLAIFLAGGLPAGAQVDFQSYDPVGDSVVVARMRARMDRIRRRRPTVALVLSGGGAKGAAHVGVLRFLEEEGIPVDMVLGTSMGGLVGGLYSIGYSPDFLDSLFRTADWDLALSDRVPQDLIAYRQKKYKEKYFASVPFYYGKTDMFNRSQNRALRQHNDGLHFGAGDETGERTMMENLFGSLPSGYIFGHNVNNIFSGLTVGYQDDTDFTTLPIPYFCIATEMVSGKALLWHEGKLNTALRSTMSIPGIFAPVRTDGKILVDGGMRNNYPTDIAKEMGADVVIGVELSDKNMTYQDINNIADLVWQAVDILGRDSFEKNVDIPDITIKPDLHEYNMMSFDTESIETIIGRGYAAAKEKEEEIRTLKQRLGSDVTEFHNTPAVDIGEIPIVLSGIAFTGVTGAEEDYLLGKLNIKPWDKVYKKDLEEAVSTILATGSFDFVQYELLNDENSYILNIICQKGPVHQAGIGMRFDTETVVSALVNLGLNVHRIKGSAWDFTAKIASNPYLDVHYSLRFPAFPTINAVIHGSSTNASIISPESWESDMSGVNFKYRRFSQKLYFPDLNWKKADVRLGIKNEYFKVASLLAASFIPDEYDIKNLSNDFLTFFAEGRADTFDSGYFPSRGYSIGATYNYVMGGLISEIDPVHIVQFDAAKVFRTGGILDIIPSLYTRLAIGKSLPMAFMNIAGGTLQGRYLEQQVPFIGINYATPLSNKMIKLGIDFRLHLTKNNWLSLKGEAMKHSDAFDSDLLLTGDTLAGLALEYSYNTIMGPLRLNVHNSNLTQRVGAYMSFGFDF
jgi:NTE family protein